MTDKAMPYPPLPELFGDWSEWPWSHDDWSKQLRAYVDADRAQRVQPCPDDDALIARVMGRGLPEAVWTTEPGGMLDRIRRLVVEVRAQRAQPSTAQPGETT